jgi:DUF4097 and DUF4098 domain-containing protein YvlB
MNDPTTPHRQTGRAPGQPLAQPLTAAPSPWPAPTPPQPPTAPTASRAARLAWLIPGGILAAAALVLGTYNVLSVLAHDERTERSAFPAAEVTSVDVASSNGSVTITGDATDSVAVVAEISDGWRATDVDVAVVDGVLRARSSCPVLGSPWCSTDFRISVPADMEIRVDASNGSVTADGLSGAVDVDTDNGSIEVSELSGTLRATNDNGRIVGRRLAVARADASTENGRIELAFVEPPDDVRGRSQNGSIDVVVPDDDVAYRVQLETDNGSTDIAVRTDPSSPHAIDLATDNGSLAVRVPDR